MEENKKFELDPQALAIKEYLDTQILSDSVLKEKYEEQFLIDCSNYVTAKAKELLNGKNGLVRDEVVFKWVRDYFIDDIYLEEQEKKKKEAAEAEERNRKYEEEKRKREEQNAITQKQKEEEKKEEARKALYSDETSLFFGFDDSNDVSEDFDSDSDEAENA